MNTLIAATDLFESRALFGAMADIRGSHQHVFGLLHVVASKNGSHQSRFLRKTKSLASCAQLRGYAWFKQNV